MRIVLWGFLICFSVMAKEMVSSSSDNYCFWDSEELQCWKRKDFSSGPLKRVSTPALKDPKDLKVNSRSGCAIDEGKLKCWGAIYLEAMDLEAPRLLAVGSRHVCVVDKGKVVCFGSGKSGQKKIPPLTEVTQLVAGAFHNCALSREGVSCWGGEGKSNYDQAKVPTGLTEVVSVAAGGTHSCALRKNGELVCWGQEELATPPSGFVKGPVRLLSLGLHHTCVLDSENVKCWGKKAEEAGPAPAPSPADFAVTSWTINQPDAQKIYSGGNRLCVLGAATGGCYHTGSETAYVALNPQEIRFLSLGTNNYCYLSDKEHSCGGLVGASQERVKNAQGVQEYALGGESNGCVIQNKKLSCWGETHLINQRETGSPEQLFLGRDTLCLKETNKIKCFRNGGVSESFTSPFTHKNIRKFVSGWSVDSCVLDDAGVRCWNYEGTPYLPGFKNPREVAVASEMILAIGDNGLECFSKQRDACKKTPKNLNNPRGLVAYYENACVISDEGVTCWGASPNPPPSPVTDALELKLTYQGGCVRTKGGIDCWHKDSYPKVLENITPDPKARFQEADGEDCIVSLTGVTCPRQVVPESLRYLSSFEQVPILLKRVAQRFSQTESGALIRFANAIKNAGKQKIYQGAFGWNALYPILSTLRGEAYFDGFLKNFLDQGSELNDKLGITGLGEIEGLLPVRVTAITLLEQILVTLQPYYHGADLLVIEDNLRRLNRISKGSFSFSEIDSEFIKYSSSLRTLLAHKGGGTFVESLCQSSLLILNFLSNMKLV